jgi:hypothetical protein
MKNNKFTLLALIFFALTALSSQSFAGDKKNHKPVKNSIQNTVKKIHLDQYGGYFESKETLAGLKSGEYEITITNKTNRIVGFQIQNFKTHDQLDMFPLEPNETRISNVTITSDGFRFRCPINPTPWYDMDNVKDES